MTWGFKEIDWIEDTSRDALKKLNWNDWLGIFYFMLIFTIVAFSLAYIVLEFVPSGLDC